MPNPLRPGLRRTSVLVLALALLVPTGAAGAEPAAPGDAVVPPRLPEQVRRICRLVGGSGALGFSVDQQVLDSSRPVTHLVRTGDGTQRRVLGTPVSAAGGKVLTGRAGALTLHDLVSGSARPFPALGAGTGAGTVQLLEDEGTVQASDSTEPTTVTRTGPDGAVLQRVELPGHPSPYAVSGDVRAALVSARSRRQQGLEHWFVDLDAGRAVQLPVPAGGQVALSRSHVVVKTPDELIRLRRPDLQGISRLPAAGAVEQFAATDEAAAWTAPAFSPQPLEVVPGAVHTLRADGAGGVVVLEDPPQSGCPTLFGLDDRLVLLAGQTSATRGVYPLAAGQRRLGAPLALAGGTAPTSTALGTGRVLTLEPVDTAISRYAVVEHPLARAVDGGLTAGPERQLLDVGSGLLTLGGLVAQTSGDLLGTDVVLADRAGEFLRRRVPGAVLALEGTRVVTTDGRTAHPSVLVDLASGARLTFPGRTAVEGARVAVLGADGSVVLKEGGQPDRVLRPAGTPGRSLDLACSELRISGDDVLWSLCEPGPSDPTRPPDLDLFEVRVVGLDGSPRWAPEAPVRTASLTAGRVAWADADDLDVHVLDLGAEDDVVVGRLTDLAFQPTGTVALGTDAVAWTLEDGSTAVHPLPGPVGPPRLLGRLVPAAAGPQTGFVLRLALDRAAGPSSLVITDSRGAVVSRSTPSAPDGLLRASWDGRLPDGSAAPDGTYRWTLGPPPEGVVVGAPSSGTFRWDRTAPSVRVSSTSVTSDVSTSGAQRIAWASYDPAARFDVTVSLRVPGPGGRTVWSPENLWRDDVPAGNALDDGQGGRVELRAGDARRFTVTANDAAGNRTTRSVVGLLPTDDRDETLRFSSGWTRAADRGAYRGTVTRTTAAGRTLTLTTSTDRFVLVGTRCPTCGRVTVRVDGRVVRTVDTYASAVQQRVRLLDHRVAASPGRHTLTVTTEGTPGRPEVRVDGVATFR